MPFLKKITLLLLVISQANILGAQHPPNLKFKKYGIEDGLSQVTSRCLLEDQQGYIWIGTQDGLNRFDGYSFKVFRNDPERPKSLSSSFINCILQDSNGKLLIGTKAGLNIYDENKEAFSAFQNQLSTSNSLSNNNVTALLEDSKNRIWIGTENGLNLMNHQTTAFERYYHDPTFSSSLSNNNIHSLLEDSEGNIWIGTENGLNLFNEERQSFLSFHHSAKTGSSLSSNVVTNIFQDNDGQIWVGTANGLNQFDFDGKFRRYRHDANDATSIGGNNILSIFQDSKENLWVGTANGGLNLYNHSSNTFIRYQHDVDDPSSISNNTIWSITEDRTGNLWVGVSNQGINFHDPRTQNFEHIKYQSSSDVSLLDNVVRSILLDNEEQLWVGSFTGLTVIDTEKNRVRQYQHNPDDPNSLSADYIISISQDHQNRIWLGTRSGLNLYSPKDDNFIRFEGNDEVSLKNTPIGSILQDHKNQMWIGTYNRGVFRINVGKGVIEKYTINSDRTDFSQSLITCIVQDSESRIWVGAESGLYLFDPKKETFQIIDSQAIGNNGVTNITQDKKGRIWVGTNSGLNLFDPKNNTFKTYHEKDGISNAVIYGVLADDNGYLWLSTNKGLNKFSPDQESFVVYDATDGLQSDEFNSKAYHKDKNGFLYFGGVNGLSIFHPDSVHVNAYLPPVVLTDFLLFNKSVQVNDTTVLPGALNYLEEIALEYHQDMFAFEFSALNYKQSEKNQFAYKLEPFNKDWIYTDSEDRKAVFTRIPPGSYTFHVKASNDDGYWNEQAKTIKIKIHPPWWLTWWAILLYTLLSLLILILIVRFQWKRTELKNRLKLEQKEAEQFKELDQLKTQFFSNITHEFRTPLTLIMGPSEQILKQPKLDESFTRTQIEMILRNSRKFLHLVNQLLDLSKLESQQMSLDLYQGDFSEFVKGIVEQFASAAKQKKVQLGFHSKLPVNDYLFDRDKMDKVLFNLLSNASKFTPENGSIEVQLQLEKDAGQKTDRVMITIEDNGIGIPADQLNQVFDRFYQVDSSTKRKQEGTGIGLALTKELIEVHGGNIEVASESEKGTVFTISLPLEIATSKLPRKKSVRTNDDLPADLAYSTLEKEVDLHENNHVIDPGSDQPIVLIIEDNNDLREFITSVIGADYQTITAKDGVEGIAVALENIPDLIISDVMMPEKDGFEVTHALKNNPLSSHIPIILLTAKSTLQSRVTGLQKGADAYLTKPFSVEELTLVANRQIETRKVLQAKFSSPPDNEEREISYQKIDQELIDKLHNFIEINLSNEELMVDELVKEAAMSHSQLYRKIKALTDLSIASFIRNYRLVRALEILEAGEHNVTEVANITGFGDRRYFHKTFVDKFSYPPSQVLKN